LFKPYKLALTIMLAVILLGGQAWGEEVPFGAFRGYNLIYIQMESIQQFLIGSRVDGREVTPNLNRLHSSGVSFSRCYAQTGMGNTSDAELLAMCSILPLPDGAAFKDISKPMRSLPRALKEAGYHTYAFHGNSPSVWNRKKVYPLIGIDRYYHQGALVNDQLVGLGISDLSLSRQLIHTLSRGLLREPFFALVMTLSSHHPYKVDKVWDFDSGKFQGTTLGDYLQSANYTDHAVGLLVDWVTRSPLGRRTIIALYGDHRAPGIGDTEELNRFLEMNSMERLTREPHRQRDFGRVPMILLIPSREGYLRLQVDRPVGQLDLAPTVAHLLGIPFEGAGQNVLGEGTDLVPFPQDEIIYRDYWSAFGGKRVVDLTLNASAPPVLNPQWREAERVKALSRRMLGLP